MELKLGATVSYFLWSVLAGGSLAFLYDFLRSSRRIFRTSVIGVNLEDVLFFLLSGVLIFWLAYDKNNGMLRFQGFLGLLSGFWMYRILFRDLFVCFLVWISGLFMKSIFFLIKLISFPIMIVFRILSKPFLVIGWYSRQGLNRAEVMARTLTRRKKLLKKARNNQKKCEGDYRAKC